jgi:hypothetical protein
VITKKLTVPKFDTEAEEARWWDEHMDIVEENLVEAMDSGTAKRGGPRRVLEERNIPQFNSEAEEADWWYEHRAELEEEFLQAAKEGRLKRGSTVLERIRARQLHLTLPDEDRNRVRELTDKRRAGRM